MPCTSLLDRVTVKIYLEVLVEGDSKQKTDYLVEIFWLEVDIFVWYARRYNKQ